jgi:hypothetical protein
LITCTETQFAGYDCLKLDNGALALWLTRGLGPRIIGLALAGGESLFAVLPDDKVECPGAGIFSFRGGHRLWYAPEDLRRTYLPDDVPPNIQQVPAGLVVTQPVEAPTGIQKSMTITLPGADAHVQVTHRLHNRGPAPVDLAPWAITQLRPGGVALLPQATAPADEHGLLPNHHLVLWPYTRLDSPHVTWGDGYLAIEAAMPEGAFKVGFPNPAGWLAYAVDDCLFVKRATYQAGAEYFDRGSSSECYCNPRFLELETLGPRATLAPGQEVSHDETWTIQAGVARPRNPAEAWQLVGRLGTGFS